MKITACGHLKSFLQTQLDGLTGHPEVAGYPFDRVEWGQPDYVADNDLPQWWVYEQTAYWVDGLTRCAIALDDEAALERASRIIYRVIDHPDTDGYLGPRILKSTPSARWPHVVFFRACLALYERNRDARIIQALKRHYLGCPFSYERFRDVLNAEIILRIYLIDRDPALLALAEEILDRFNQLPPQPFFQNNDATIASDERPVGHGVTYNEYSKMGALRYLATGNTDQLNLSLRAIAKLVRFFLLPGQVNCSDEQLISKDPYEATETCDVSDFTYAVETIMAAADRADLGDLVERAVFNGGIGCVLENFRGLQYFSSANQMILDAHSNHVAFNRGSKWMSYRPNPGTECCAGNVNRFMPNYVLHMYRQRDDRIFIDLFGPSRCKAMVKGDQPVVITQETRFPLEDRIVIKVQTEGSLQLELRIPKYANRATVTIGGRTVDATPGEYLPLAIEGDTTIVLDLAPEIEILPTPRGGIYLRRGPLVYAQGCYGQRLIDQDEERSTPEFPAYNIYPDQPWGYAVHYRKKGEASLAPAYRAGTSETFSLKTDLPSIEITAAPLLGLKPAHRDRIFRRHTSLDGAVRSWYEKGDYNLTPDVLALDLPLGPTTRIKLYPYGACKVRQTVFQDRDSVHFQRYLSGKKAKKKAKKHN